MIFKYKFGLGTALLGRKPGEHDNFADFVISSGCRLFDTAEKYVDGNAEILLGKAIKRSTIGREEFNINTKFTPDLDPEVSLGLSLQRLQMDYVDSYMVHWLTPELRSSNKLKALIEKLLELKSKGLTKNIGSSNLSVHELDLWLKAERELGIEQGQGITVCQYKYSLVKREADIALHQKVLDLGFTAMPYSPFGGGRMSGSSKPPQPGYHNDFWDNERTKRLWPVAESIGATLPQLILAFTNRFQNSVSFPTVLNRKHFLEDMESIKFIPLITKSVYDKITESYPISFSVQNQTNNILEFANNRQREALPD